MRILLHNSLNMAREAGENGRPIDESLAKAWHEAVTRHQVRGRSALLPFLPWPPMNRGRYKIISNDVLDDQGKLARRCPVRRTAREMAKIYVQTERHLHGGVDTLACAAWLHYAWIYVHPFVDGNGRTARLAVAHVFCRRREHPPVIEARRRSEYFKKVAKSESGDLEALRSLLEKSAVQALEQAIEHIRARHAQSDRKKKISANLGAG